LAHVERGTLLRQTGAEEVRQEEIREGQEKVQEES
jgi:hypothetical protein